MSVTSDVIKRLREEQPELLKDVPEVELKDYDLSNLDPDMAPSEIKKLADAIARKRLSAPSLTEVEAKNLMRRIGHSK
jgi:hypothetical protein